MLSENIYENIDAYLNGTLTETDLAEFERQLQNDSNLAADVELFRQVDTTLGNQASLDFHQKAQVAVDNFLEELALEEKDAPKAVQPIQRIGRWSRRWAIAASFLFLALCAVLIWQLQSPTAPSHAELYAQNFTTYPLDESERGEEGDQSDFEKGIEQYKSKDFAGAAQTFAPLVETSEGDMVLAFCLANAYLNQTPPMKDLANTQFQRIVADGGSVYVPKAQWYLALNALKEGKLEETKRLLEEVRKSGDEFAKKAEQLLKDLD